MPGLILTSAMTAGGLFSALFSGEKLIYGQYHSRRYGQRYSQGGQAKGTVVYRL